jgi:hypothetical protein
MAKCSMLFGCKGCYDIAIPQMCLICTAEIGRYPIGRWCYNPSFEKLEILVISRTNFYEGCPPSLDSLAGIAMQSFL